jgi:hypothetical protein
LGCEIEDWQEAPICRGRRWAVRELFLRREYGKYKAAFDEVWEDPARRVSGRPDHSRDRFKAARS